MFTQRKSEPTSLDMADTLRPYTESHMHPNTQTHGGPGSATQTETAKARPAMMTSPLSWSHPGRGAALPLTAADVIRCLGLSISPM